MHLSAIFVEAVATIFTPRFTHATPDMSVRPHDTTHDWSYRNLYDYPISKGGPNDLIAQVLLTHLNNTGLGWDEKYAHDIVLNNGVLTVAQSPGGRAELDSPWMDLCGGLSLGWRLSGFA